MRNKGLLLSGSFRKAGVTIYAKEGHSIARPSMSIQPRRRTAAQFEVRERFHHNRKLWAVVQKTGLINRRQFYTLATKLPALYLTRMEHFRGYTLLVPGTPVACGTLPDVGCRLGTVGGRPALLTDLDATLPAPREQLVLVTLEQVTLGERPRLAAGTAVVPPADFSVVDGRLALVDDRFGDDHYGWALVRQWRGRCSTQTVVTAASAYRRYLTPEAQQRAADSYGGLTPP